VSLWVVDDDEYEFEYEFEYCEVGGIDIDDGGSRIVRCFELIGTNVRTCIGDVSVNASVCNLHNIINTIDVRDTFFLTWQAILVILVANR